MIHLRRSTVCRIALALLFSIAGQRLAAQTVNCTTSNGNQGQCTIGAPAIAFSIGKVVQLTVVQGVSFNLQPTGGLLSATNYDNALFNVDGSVQLQVKSNTSWQARVSSAASFTSGCSQGKNADGLLWGTATGNRTTPMTTSPVNVFTGAATELSTQHVYFAVKLGWTSDAPVSLASNCALPVTFSALAP